MSIHGTNLRLAVSSATAVGYKERGGVNQDAACYGRSDSGTLVAAVADGVGSLPDSQAFSAAATAAAAQCTAEVADAIGQGPEALHRLIRQHVRAALLPLADLAGATTLLYGVAHDGLFHWGMIGDGAIVLFPVDGGEPRVVQMQGREFGYTDVVDPDDIDSHRWSTGVAPLNRIELVALMTDGVSDAVEDPGAFFGYLRSRLAGLEGCAASSRLRSILRDFPEKHGDDKSLVMIRVVRITDKKPVVAELAPVQGRA